jgi:hypothetical protein
MAPHIVLADLYLQSRTDLLAFSALPGSPVVHERPRRQTALIGAPLASLRRLTGRPLDAMAARRALECPAG